MKVFVFCLLAVNFILALFLKGFFPVKIVSKEHATSKIKWDTIEKEPVTYKKVVLMIIDALRSDFAFGIYNFFPKAQAIIKNGHGIGFTAVMQPPTVTLPRIKAIVTGDTPSFADVVHNFAATAVEEDSVLLQLRKEKRKIFFFGDDTWIKLFPGYFDKSDGTSSFFVSDFTEVDSNVSRHLSNELSFPEWDLMILHYLGLDHIGHVTGPHSPLIQPKLSAMDAAIDQIYSAMEKWNDLSLLIICGDHGMSDQGGHGGGSLAEITVPVLFLSPQFSYKKSHQQTKVVSQIDLCPTLSTLLGIPIPNNNIGKVITDALHGFTVLQKLTVLNSNAIQVVQVFKKYYPEFEKDSTYQLYKKTTSQFNTWKVSKNSTDTTIWEKEGYSLLLMYTECLTAIAHKIQSLSTQYDNYILAVSMVLLWMLCAVIFIHLLQDTQNSYSAPLSTYVYQICLVFGSAVLSHIVMCTGAVPSELMCRSTYVSISIQIVMAFIFIVCSVYLLNKLPSCHWSQIIKWRQDNTMTEMFLAVGSVVHMCTYFSSSYIEEEHQTFYFISTGVHVVLILHLIYLYFLYNSNTEPYFLNTALCQKSSDGRHGDYHKKQCSELNRCKDCLILLCNILIILILLRALRRWNQTGNKWLDVPDIGDWLVLPDNKLYLSMCVAFSLIIIGVTRGHQVNRLQSLLINLSLTITYFYLVATGHLFSPKSTFLSLRGIVEARTTFFLIAMTFISSALPSAFFNLENKDLTAFELNTIGNQKCFTMNNERVLNNHLKEGQNTRNKFICTRKSLLNKMFFCYKQAEIYVDRDGTFMTLHQRLNVISSAFLCYMCLVGRPHNIPVVMMLSIIEQMIIPVLINVSLKLPYTLLYCQLMGQSFFFFQGNSNSLSTLDLTAGYTGLNEFNPFITGFHICLSTFSGTIFWSLTFLKVCCLMSYDKKYHSEAKMYLDVTRSVSTLLLSLSSRSSLYTSLIAIQRHHLFIWTVFSPKLLYESVYIIVHSILICFTSMFLKLKQNLL